MSALIFPGAAVLELLAHAKAAKTHSSGYGNTSNPGPGLLLVKDSGIYLMSNAIPHQPAGNGETCAKVVYATGFEPAAAIKMRGGDWNAQYEKIVAAAGGDDFVEFLGAANFVPLAAEGHVEIVLTQTHMDLSVVTPTEDGPTRAR